MSTCIPTAAAAVADKSASASSTAATSISSSSLSLLSRRHHFHSLSNAVFPLSSKSKLRLFSKAGISGSSSGAAAQSEVSAKEIKNGKPSSEPIPAPLASEDSISEFIDQVASLVKLVDSRDIVELHMKQYDCELLIRKKEAIQQAPPPLVYTMQAPSTQPPQASPPVSLVASPPTPTTSSTPAPATPKATKSSVPPLKSPMSGTFYRSPAPGAPPFVKVGDKVQKGQVVCIIEAMKLMNEIEADQSGTLVEVIAEDGKPISIDSPLFVIQP